MRPDPQELRRIQWLPPLRLQLYLGAPPDSLSEEHRRQLERAHARRRAGLGVLAGIAISSLVAGSSITGAAASAEQTLASAADRPAAQVGVGAEPNRLGYPAAIVPDNAAKGGGVLPGVLATTVPTFDVNDLGGDHLGIPAVALSAYRSAAVSMETADPGCRLDWSLIAGVGRVESDHGQYGGRRPAADGTVAPPILGIPLDGRPGVALIRDTDDGRLDFDTTYDRAVGPMQFIPSTWAAFPDADGDGDGVVDPHNLYDAALAAASYLCSGPGDLSEEAGQRSAVFRYNHSDSYVDLVLAYAEAYAAGVVLTDPPPLPAGPPPAVPEDPITDPAHPGDPLPDEPAPPPTTTTPPPGSSEPPTEPPGSSEPPPGTEEPPPGSSEPPPGTEEPPPGSSEPPPGSSEPPPGTEEPPPGTEEPPPGTEEPPPGTEEPPPGTEEPPPATEEPPSDPTGSSTPWADPSETASPPGSGEESPTP